jgi:hypothetical protein
VDLDLRASLRAGDPVRAALLLRRDARTANALDELEPAWLAGDARAGELWLAIARETDERDRLALAPRLDRLACAGVAAARSLWRAWFPEVAAIVGASAGARALRAFVYEHAAASEPILLGGESGAGHFLAARAFHALSGRGSFHHLPPVFNDERFLDELRAMGPGSFLYVAYARPGPWETVALDVSSRFGVRLLVGSVEVDRPWVALGAAPAHRIAPLRERREDVPALVAEIVSQRSRSVTFAPDALAALAAHDWPGNVRELEGVVLACLARGRGIIRREDLPRGIAWTPS